MSRPRFRLSDLRRLLLDLGFKEAAVNTGKPHIGFQHEASELLIVLPSYRDSAAGAPHHLVYVRAMLDGKGLMDAGECDRLVGNVPAPRSASS